MIRLLIILVCFPSLSFSQLGLQADTSIRPICGFYQFTPPASRLIPRATITPNGRVGFYEFTPPGYQADSRHPFPLIIFLHGVGERGDGRSELPMVLNTSFPKLLANGASMNFAFHGKKSGFVVLLPQMSKEYFNWQNFYVDAMIDYAAKHLNVDQNRIFLCGWSLGGGGAWKYTTTSDSNALRIAGIVVTGPAPDYEDLSYIAKERVAVWAHHAQDDASVPLHLTSDAVQAINSYSPHIRAIISYYPSGGHPLIANAPFDTLHTYLYPNMYEWMMGTSKKNTLATNRPPVPIAGNDTAVTIPHPLVLDGSASFDPEDVIIRYRWKMVAGPPSAHLSIHRPFRPVTNVSGLEPGSYVFRLTVQDEFGFTRSSDIRIYAHLPAGRQNALPYVNAGNDTATCYDHISIRGYAKDFDGSIVHSSWRQISGPASLSIAQHNLSAFVQHMTEAGEYGIELTAYDNCHPAGTNTDTVFITKNPSIPVSLAFVAAKDGFSGMKNVVSPGLLMLLTFFVLTPFFITQFTYKICSLTPAGNKVRYKLAFL